MNNDIATSKKKEALVELESWFNQTNAKERFYDQNVTAINQLIQEKINPKSIFRLFDYLTTWYRSAYSLHAIKQDNKDDFRTLAQYSYFTSKLASLTAKKFPGNPPNLGFHFPAFYLANIINAGWREQTVEVCDYILEGLATKFFKGGQQIKVIAWFIIQIACKAFGRKLPTTGINYPASLGVYNEVLQNWNTVDLVVVDKLISAMCDYHLDQANFGTDDNNMSIQFNTASESVFCYEILAWLSLRKMSALPILNTFSHPLFHLYINNPYKTVMPFTSDTLFDSTVAYIKKEFGISQINYPVVSTNPLMKTVFKK